MKTPKTDRWRYHKQLGAPVHKGEVCYEALAVAIIKQAILDYQFADQVAKGRDKKASPRRLTTTAWRVWQTRRKTRLCGSSRASGMERCATLTRTGF